MMATKLLHLILLSKPIPLLPHVHQVSTFLPPFANSSLTLPLTASQQHYSCFYLLQRSCKFEDHGQQNIGPIAWKRDCHFLYQCSSCLSFGCLKCFIPLNFSVQLVCPNTQQQFGFFENFQQEMHVSFHPECSNMIWLFSKVTTIVRPH